MRRDWRFWQARRRHRNRMKLALVIWALKEGPFSKKAPTQGPRVYHRMRSETV